MWLTGSSLGADGVAKLQRPRDDVLALPLGQRKGGNPATGEEITIAAKPASVDVRSPPLAKAKPALQSVQKARRRLAA